MRVGAAGSGRFAHFRPGLFAHNEDVVALFVGLVAAAYDVGGAPFSGARRPGG